MTARPSSGKDELSRLLRDLRSTAGLSTRQAGDVTGFSQAKVSRIERGVNVPTVADVAVLADAYRAPGGVRRRMLSLADDLRAETRPVVMSRGRAKPGVFQQRLARIEAASAHVRAFAPTAVPGLLQTETYMRSLMAYRELPPDRLDAFVAGRLLRQRILGSAEHEFTLITTEGALGWRLGSREDMAAQAERIAEATRIPNVRVGVIPWGAQASVLPLHGWDVYDSRAVSYGTTEATAVLTEPRDVARYRELFERVQAMAVLDDAARALLAQVVTRYRAPG